MGSITPLLDTLLHQVLGRQLSLESHARRSLGPSAVNGVVRDAAGDDATQTSDGDPPAKGFGRPAGKAYPVKDRQSDDPVNTRRGTESSSSLQRGIASRAGATSAQLNLSDAARVLNARAHSGLPPFDNVRGSDESRSHRVFSKVIDTLLRPPALSSLPQPSILLPLPPISPQLTLEDRAEIIQQLIENRQDDSSVIGLDGSVDTPLELSRVARQLNLWTDVLTRNEWQTVLKSSVLTPIPLALPVADAVDQPSLSPDALSLARNDMAETLSATLWTSGLFHEAIVAQWSKGLRSQQQVEESALQRQQLLAMLPKAPEFGDSVIRQQLQLMAGQRIQFQCELWAGAMLLMSFRTEPYAADRSQNDSAERRFPAFPEQRRVWTLTLTFELPLLGNVTAEVHWDDERLTVGLNAESESTRALLMAEHDRLEQLLSEISAQYRTQMMDQ